MVPSPSLAELFAPLATGDAAPAPCSDVAGMLARLAPSSELAAIPSARRAAIAGAGADRLGVAFVAGYAAALERLVPGLGPRACLAATEQSGAHPRAIATRLEGDRVTGEKTFATLATSAEHMLVVATENVQDARDRPSLRVAVVRTDAPGVTITPRGPTPFAPEVPHARVTFERAPVERVLPGDGYDLYLKPFRTIEDVHVVAAALGYATRLARLHPSRDALRPIVECAVALIFALSAIADEPVTGGASAATHLALAGVLSGAHALFGELSTALASPRDELDELDERADLLAELDRFERDRPLLLVAQNARDARRVSAWDAVARA